MKYLYCIFITLLTFTSFSQNNNQPTTPSVAAPKLVVGIVVDQMRYDYLYRYSAKYGNGGFKRLMNDGFNCKNNHYHYAITTTGPGHAAIYTGSVPAITGIIGNDWFDPISNQGMYVVEDTMAKTVGAIAGTEGQRSPKNMLTRLSLINFGCQIALNPAFLG